ncbi:MAG: hypothetical protein KBT03_06560 [Bacteroidales bacterium]|nr:hypothetical protein [Candidatus Scybalousia scybalohippi]
MSVYKNGIVQGVFSSTLMCKYDPNFYVEPDGSVWIRIFHHNNPASKLFASTDTFATSVYKDADRWFNVSLCDQVDNWEMMVKQKSTVNDAEVKHRWIQQTNPMGGTWQEVNPSSSLITRITTSGYSTSTVGGGIYRLNSYTYLCIANASNGNWFGAIGCWNVWNNGIPAYPNTGVTTGYMDLYLRVDNVTNDKVSKTKIGYIAKDFIEY